MTWNLRYLLCCTAIFCLMVPASLSAQSPFRLESSRELSLAAGGVLLGSINFIISDNNAPFTESQIAALDRSTINPIDRSATFKYSLSAKKASDILVGCSIAAPVLLFFDKRPLEDWQTLSVIYLETAAFATIIPQLIKKSTERTRPYVYNRDVPFTEKTTADSKHSFLSGHSTWGFASASFLSTVYGEYYPTSKWKTLVWSGSFLIATAIGYLRYEAGYHYPTDIIAGAGLGTIIGYVVPYLHKTDQIDLDLGAYSIGGDVRISLSCRW